MKKVLVLVLVIAMTMAVSASAQDWSGYTDDELTAKIDELTTLLSDAQTEKDRREQASLTKYTSKYADFTVKPYFKDGFDLLLEYRWTNTSESTRTFNTTLEGVAYQNDKKLSTALLLFDPESNRFEDVSPGKQSIAYECFKISDMSDITVYIDWPYAKTGDIVLTIKVSELEPYKSK